MGLFDKLKKEKEAFICPMGGTIMGLEMVPDEVFSTKMMGDGFAVDFAGGEVVAPVTGEVVTVFPTGHAYGIRTAEGMEVLIHIGMDTVELDGEGFEICVKQGNKIKQGKLLAKVDADVIRSHGKSLISPVIFTSGEHIKVSEDGKIEITSV